MGYYLPFHDYGAAQYGKRIDQYPSHHVLAPVKISKHKKVKREDCKNDVPANRDGNKNKANHPNWISQSMYVNQTVLFDIEGKGKYMNESV